MQCSDVDCLHHGLSPLPSRHETKPITQQKVRTLDVHKSRVTEPLSVFVLRVGLASIKEIDETQIKSHGHGWSGTRVIENLADNVEGTTRIDGGSDVLYHSSCIF